MRYLIAAAMMLLTTVPSILPAQDLRQVKYQRWGLFGGYKDKPIGPNSWRVLAGVNGVAPEGSAFNIALYRAAELSKLAGFKYFQIINQKGKQSYIALAEHPPEIALAETQNCRSSRLTTPLRPKTVWLKNETFV